MVSVVNIWNKAVARPYLVGSCKYLIGRYAAIWKWAEKDGPYHKVKQVLIVCEKLFYIKSQHNFYGVSFVGMDKMSLLCSWDNVNHSQTKEEHLDWVKSNPSVYEMLHHWTIYHCV